MEVRRIRPDELDKLLALYAYLHTEAPMSVAQLQPVWERIRANEDQFIYWVIEQNGIFVSSCNLSIIPNLTRGGRSIGLIENVVTHANYRKQGLGKRVMQEAIAHAQRMGCYKIMLLSNAQRTEAHHFYEQLGFDSHAKKGFTLKLE